MKNNTSYIDGRKVAYLLPFEVINKHTLLKDHEKSLKKAVKTAFSII